MLSALDFLFGRSGGADPRTPPIRSDGNSFDDTARAAQAGAGSAAARQQGIDPAQESRNAGSGAGQQQQQGREQQARQDLRQGRNLLDSQTLDVLREEQEKEAARTGQDSKPLGSPDAEQADSTNPNELTEEEEKIVRELQKRDQEVRRHEQAHKSAGGPLASPPVYQYTKGPDGRSYAVSGEVKIDASPEREPEDTIRKMEQVKRAALAPAEPSPQDRQVAAQAEATKAQAQQELNRERKEEADAKEAERDRRQAEAGVVNGGASQDSGAGLAAANAASPINSDPTSLLQRLRAVETYGRTASVLGRSDAASASQPGFAGPLDSPLDYIRSSSGDAPFDRVDLTA